MREEEGPLLQILLAKSGDGPFSLKNIPKGVGSSGFVVKQNKCYVCGISIGITGACKIENNYKSDDKKTVRT